MGRRLAWFGVAASFALGCSSSGGGGAFSTGDSGPGGGSGSGTGDSGIFMVGTGSGSGLMSGDAGHLGTGPDSGGSTGSGDGSTTTVTTTIYATTDTELYSINPMNPATTPTDLGTYQGTSGGEYDSTVTDLAVDAEGDVYVNTETVIYKVTLPTTPGPGAAVALTKVVATFTGTGTPPQKFYALGFAPAGLLGSGETLVGGDGNGNLWAIPTSGGSIQNLGSFGNDPSASGSILALSGDIVFYTNTMNQPTGLATIRSCKQEGSGSNSYLSCNKTDDYLAEINIPNLKANYSGNTTTNSLLYGIFGGSTTADGPGTGHGEIFGLGAWQGDVYGFTNCIDCYDGGTNPVIPTLLSISSTTGAGTQVNTTPYTFTNGWAGAGVTTKVTVTVAPPPPVTQPK